jgi:CHAD domain-containing protein
MGRVAAARSRRTVRLKTAKGTRRVRLPRPDGARASRRRSPLPLDKALGAAVDDRARRLGRRVRRGIPMGRTRIDEAVHDLRTSARRLLAALLAVRPLLGRKRSRRLSRRIERVLDRSGELRDVGVELQMLSALGSHEAEIALRPLRERLRDKHEALARKLHRRLRRPGPRRIRRDIRRALERSGRGPATASAVRGAALAAAREGFSRLRKSRLAVSPAEVETIHRMRIDLKEFRYLMEALRPVAVGVSRQELESLHELQTTMGDLHDLEVLSATIARHVAKVQPETAPHAAAVLQTLEERHSAMLTSFLQAVDPILDSWERILSSRRRWASRS